MNLLIKHFMRMGLIKKHIVYWIVPSVITLTCILVYFFDVFGLSSLMAPQINREFGVVENLQLILLLSIVVICFRGIRISNTKRARQWFRFITVFAILLFLEEIDYGLHYYDYLMLPTSEATTTMIIDYDNEIRNLHNNGKAQNISKLIAYTLVVAFFVIIPLLPSKLKERYTAIKYLSPSVFTVTTAVAMLVVNNIALYLYRSYNYDNPALNGNVSEFEEIMIYYMFLLYVSEMVFQQKLSAFFQHNLMKRNFAGVSQQSSLLH